MDLLIDPAWLFRFSIPIKKAPFRSDDREWVLGSEYALPYFGVLSKASGYGVLKMAWSAEGIFIQVDVERAGRRPTYGDNIPFDKLTVWLDTRNSPDIHRATRYCYCFQFKYLTSYPTGLMGYGTWVPIARAKERPPNVSPEELRARLKGVDNGYRLNATLKSTFLNGFDPEEFPTLGFFYELVDREAGTQTLSVGTEMKYDEDPSFWSQLTLQK